MSAIARQDPVAALAEQIGQCRTWADLAAVKRRLKDFKGFIWEEEWEALVHTIMLQEQNLIVLHSMQSPIQP